MQFNIPTWFTLFRIIMMPFLVLAFYLPFQWGQLACALIFITASITDWFDGFLARRLKQATKFGAFLDPVTDKIMASVALVLVTEHFHSWWITIPSVFMISREIVISALREWMAEIDQRNTVSVSRIGKMKTTTQMLSLIALLWRPKELVILAGIIMLYIAVMLTFWSMLRYLYVACKYLIKR